MYMKKLWVIILTIGGIWSLTACNGRLPEPIQEAVLIETGEATDISDTDATLSGVAWPTTDMKNVTVGFLWSLENNPGLMNSTIHQVDNWQAGQVFTLHLDYLSPEQTYYFRSYVQYDSASDIGVLYLGEIKSFTTKILSEVIQTRDAFDISETEATLSGVAWPKYYMQDVMVGFLWSTNSQPDIENSKKVRVENWLAGQSYTYRLFGLMPGETYYYKAYIQYAGAVHVFGEVKSFSTQDVTVSFVLNDARDIGQFTARLSGSISEPVPGDVFLRYGGGNIQLTDDYFRVFPDANGAFELLASRLRAGSKYGFRAYTTVKGKTVTSEYKYFETLGYQYSAGDAVDLGLSVLWSSVNVGAAHPENEGAYFRWGAVVPIELDNSGAAHDYQDAATTLLGDNWRIPTYEEMRELKNDCMWSREEVNGVPCYRISGKTDGETAPSIVLPATGYNGGGDLYQHWAFPKYRWNYWTSTKTVLSNRAYSFYAFSWDGSYGIGDSYFSEGLPIRPVRDR